MAVTIRNILVGAGNLYIGGPAAAIPAFVSGTPFNTTVAAATGWRHVGGTQEGVEVGYDPEMGEVEVDQLGDAALLFNTGVTVTMNTTLAEATLDNLLLSWGIHEDRLETDATTDVDTLWLGAPDADDLPDNTPPEHKLIVVGRAPKAADGARRERVYVANRAISIDAASHTLRRTEATVFPVSFRLLPDPSQPAGQEYGRIMDRHVTVVA